MSGKIQKTLYLVRETKNTVRYEEKTSREDERPVVHYIQKSAFKGGDFPSSVQMIVSW